MGAHVSGAAHALAADVAAAAPTVTIVTGDSTMRARAHQFRAARALIDDLPAPRLVIIGNHDVPLVNLVSRFTAPYERYRAHLTDELDPLLDAPGLRVLGLGSMPPWRWKSGRVSRRQTDRLATVLGGAPPDTLRVLALHHPPGQRGAARLVGRRRLLGSMATARVDLVLSGHTHVPKARRVLLPDGGGGHPVIDVVAGTATSTRTRGGVGPSWTLIRVGPESVTVEHRHYRATAWHPGVPVRFPAPAPHR
jgi:3',5'-cyclic AMP phosphodiesterase CpdA